MLYVLVHMAYQPANAMLDGLFHAKDIYAGTCYNSIAFVMQGR